MLAALLQWPQATFVSKLQFPNDNKKVSTLYPSLVIRVVGCIIYCVSI